MSGPTGSETAACARIDAFVARTRTALFVRRADGLLMIRPDKTLAINASAAEILSGLYGRPGRKAAALLDELTVRWAVARDRLLADCMQLVDTLGALLSEDYSLRPNLRFGVFDRASVAFPTLSEIALTYACQNRCAFCYASSPHRAGEHQLMRTDEVERVMEKIFFQAHVPSLSFTGGEATLRPDLCELVRRGERIGFRVNLITNGLRAADADYAAKLVDAGLASAQVSLEAADPALHDAIVGRPGAHARTVAGVGHFQRLGIHVHINSTLCAQNLHRAEETIRFAAREMGLKTLSMNMVIRTGEALSEAGRAIGVRYRQVAARLPALLTTAREEGVRFVWYSPIPYCIFNPVLHGLGAKSCACIDGILSVDPAGEVLPCSSFARGIGSLLREDFDTIYRSRAAMYWRRKAFTPPVCRDCDDVDVCGGACPLYWDAAGSFDEIPQPGAGEPRARQRWERRRKRGRSFGVRPAGA
ncbi:MAG: radical SAM protein [Deltaproteobacteria bacterium]|nr:radical SAM protein [Deltaproteobacteria bacterium]